MIDLSNLRAPGWQKIVADLASPAPDDRAFMMKLLAAIAQVSGSRQAVLFLVPVAPRGESPDQPAPEAEPRPVLTWPLPPEMAGSPERVARADVAIPDSWVERLADARSAVRHAALSRQSLVFGLDSNDMLYDASGKGFLIAVPVPGGLGPDSGATPASAVITLLLESRSRQALQTTMALVELLAGYVHTHAAGQQLRRVRSAGASLDLGARLIASINNARTFKGASIQLVNDLCRQLGVDRVAMGWVGGAKNAEGRRFSKVIAMSDTEQIDRRMAMVRKIETAMDECLDQEQAVLYPPPPVEGAGADVLLSQAITHAHRDLAAGDAKLKVASLPLRIDERVLGVMLVESTGAGAIDLQTIELLQASLDLIAPVLEIRRSDDRNLALRAWDSAHRAGAWLVGPRHTLWKIAGALVVAATLVVTLVDVTYRVSAPMRLEAREPRTVSVPFSGKIRSLAPGIEPGVRVEKGQLLFEMDTTEQQLQKLQAQSQIVEAEKKADEARKKGNISDAQQAEAQAEQARARLGLAQHNIDEARVVAPISGTIIAGDIRDKVGAAVEIGQSVFQIADLSDMVVEARVDDRDIALVRPDATGEIATKADPAKSFPFTVERIVPLSQAEEGKNAFVVRGKLSGSAPWFRPGMEGIAKFNTEEHSLAWIAGRRVIDQLRLWLWW